MIRAAVAQPVNMAIKGMLVGERRSEKFIANGLASWGIF